MAKEVDEDYEADMADVGRERLAKGGGTISTEEELTKAVRARYQMEVKDKWCAQHGYPLPCAKCGEGLFLFQGIVRILVRLLKLCLKSVGR